MAKEEGGPSFRFSTVPPRPKRHPVRRALRGAARLRWGLAAGIFVTVWMSVPAALALGAAFFLAELLAALGRERRAGAQLGLECLGYGVVAAAFAAAAFAVAHGGV